MTLKRLLLLSGAILLILSCGSPLAPFLVTDQPKIDDLLGVYAFSAQKVVDSEIEKMPESQIELLVDGKCNMVDVPVFIDNDQHGFTFKLKGFFTGDCQWRATNIGSLRKGRETLPFWGVCFKADGFDPAMECAHLANDGKPYNLVFVFGDPDVNMIMSFDKIP